MWFDLGWSKGFQGKIFRFSEEVLRRGNEPDVNHQCELKPLDKVRLFHLVNISSPEVDVSYVTLVKQAEGLQTHIRWFILLL